jgi:hypothetical protein
MMQRDASQAGSARPVSEEAQLRPLSVIVWDRGTYRNLAEKDGKVIPVPKAIEAGHVKVRLEGKKIAGGFGLTRVGGGKKPRWLLVKVDDGEASIRRNPVKTEPGSILSGRTNEEIAAQKAPVE